MGGRLKKLVSGRIVLFATQCGFTLGVGGHVLIILDAPERDDSRRDLLNLLRIWVNLKRLFS